VTTGLGPCAYRRATISSLKAHKSSMLPPPRTSNTNIAPAEPAGDFERRGDLLRRPLTLDCTGKTTTSITGYAELASSIRPEAPRLPRVITPIARGREGRARFVSASNRPSFSSLVSQLEESLEQGAEPCASHGFDIELKSPRGSYKLTSAAPRFACHRRRPLEILVALPEHDAAHLACSSSERNKRVPTWPR